MNRALKKCAGAIEISEFLHREVKLNIFELILKIIFVSGDQCFAVQWRDRRCHFFHNSWFPIKIVPVVFSEIAT